MAKAGETHLVHEMRIWTHLTPFICVIALKELGECLRFLKKLLIRPRYGYFPLVEEAIQFDQV